MTKNPIINSISATAYISLVASIIFYGPKIYRIQEPNIIIPIGMISLFTLSAAMMGYFFIFQPMQMYIDGDKKGGVRLFLQTLASFAITTLIVFIIFVVAK